MNIPPYAAAVIHLLDRETGTVKTLYCYPITKIELKNIRAESNGEFIVNDTGSWEPPR